MNYGTYPSVLQAHTPKKGKSGLLETEISDRLCSVVFYDKNKKILALHILRHMESTGQCMSTTRERPVNCYATCELTA